jgi:flagella basal body P-ring formation protein FlgA
VASGQPLTSLDVERPDLVLRGSLVHMSLNSEGIALAAEGIAKESGAQGDRILVENPTSHAIVEAQVVGRDAVMVAPRGTPFTLAAAQ